MSASHLAARHPAMPLWAPSAAAGAGAESGAADGGTAPRPRRLRILVVEDEAVTAFSIRADLTALDHEVVDVVDRGPAAVIAAARHRPDLVLMDIWLADGTDGIAAATAIRNQLGIPSVFLTGHSDVATTQRAAAARPLGFLLKPFARPQIEAMLRKAVGPLRG